MALNVLVCKREQPESAKHSQTEREWPSIRDRKFGVRTGLGTHSPSLRKLTNLDQKGPNLVPVG